VTTPVLTDGFRHRIESVTGAFHTRWLELMRDLPGNPSQIEVRRFGDGVVGTMCRRSPSIDWMQHVMGLAPGNEALVPEIATWYRGLGVRPRFEISPAGEFEPLAAALDGAGARQTGFIDALWAYAAPPAERARSDVDVRVLASGSDDAARTPAAHNRAPMLLAVLIATPLLLIWVLTLVDLFRRQDLSTGRKVLWAIVVLILPVLGVIIYFIARPPQPTDRAPTLDGVGDESFEPIRRRHGPA
jgi:hypothetical protein